MPATPPQASSRRALFGRLRGGPPQIRPPRARADFTEVCTQCGSCADACPEAIIVPGHAGYPILDFGRRGCTLCGACAAVCPEGAFDGTAAPLIGRAMISSACVEAKGVACRMCEGACEPSAIRFRPAIGGRSIVHISETDCTGCGACVRACPVAAITITPNPERDAA